MGIENRLRNLQDGVRNAGWRIQWIAWQEPGRLERVHNTPLTLFTGFGGAAVFIAAIFLVATHRASAWVLVIGLLGLAMALAGRLYAARNKQHNWIEVTARCEDREVQKRPVPVNNRRRDVWLYRLLCTFEYKGREFTVTPEPSHVTNFASEDHANTYLNERIGPDGTCTLWIDPNNPLHATFHEKQTI